MGTFNLSVSYPDEQQTRIIDGLKAHWTTTDANGDPVVPTNAEVVEHLRQVVIHVIKDIVLTVERDAAVKAAADAVTVADVS